MSVFAFLILLLVLSWTGHENLAGLLLIAFIALVMWLGDRAERQRSQTVPNGWRWPARKE